MKYLSLFCSSGRIFSRVFSVTRNICKTTIVFITPANNQALEKETLELRADTNASKARAEAIENQLSSARVSREE